jgi:putative ABC transport system ATP-binding protein
MPAASATAVLSFHQVSKIYRQSSGAELHALRQVTCRIEAGRRIALMGRSGSGKSTFLHLAAGIDLPTAGTVSVLGSDLGGLSDTQRTLLRRDGIGQVFQFFHLLPQLGVLDNVTLPELIAGGRKADYEPRARELLERVGLQGRSDDPVEVLSGGEMQRVALCRALLRRPRLLLADEPTGNLDDESGRAVMDLILEMAGQEKSTLLYVTHDPELASLADETWRIHSGVLESNA